MASLSILGTRCFRLSRVRRYFEAILIFPKYSYWLLSNLPLNSVILNPAALSWTTRDFFCPMQLLQLLFPHNVEDYEILRYVKQLKTAVHPHLLSYKRGIQSTRVA